MNLSEMCHWASTDPRLKGAIDGLLDDVEERHRSPAPFWVYGCSTRTKIGWLIRECSPPYEVEEVCEYLVSCVQP